ncbi:MAG: HAMP domain-containing histidine kinase [Nanoarchaeota archaeon]|nr:HAMP domain-containing histidine kinase [Nanoarchaeota archaeon]
MIDILHNFFFFLGTPLGEFAKKAFELLLYSLITFMVTVEFIKTRSRELKFLIIGFGTLAFQKLVMSAGYVYKIFGERGVTEFRPVFPLFEYAFESFALILLTYAFLYPAFKGRKLRLQIKVEMVLLVIITVVIHLFWFQAVSKDITTKFIDFWGFPLFMLLNVWILLMPIILFIFYKHKPIRYKFNIIIAFMVYMVAPVVHITNFVYHSHFSTRMQVAVHPFPFMSILLFTMIVYLKLVDKAQLYSKLRQSEKKYGIAKEINRMKDEFISVVSHEFRTPLTSIKLYLSLLKQKKFGKMTKKQEEAVETLSEESDRLARLIEDLLSLSKIESGKISVDIRTIDLAPVFHDPFFYKLAQKKGIDTKVDVPKPFKVSVDKERFQQILINLVSNATKFTDKGGKITVKARKLEDGWQFSVSDTGKGIDKKHQKKLFSKFFQVENYMTRHEGGFGLGLAIVKNLVDLHKGRIEVDSEPGKGSTFMVFFPES